MQIKSTDLALTEKGRTLNSGNETLLRQAAQLLVRVINSIKTGDTATEDEETPAETDKTAKEAAQFSQTDTFALLQSALTTKLGGNGYDTYIADVYEDDNAFVYRKGYNGGYYRIGFELAEDGTVTLGNPETVVRKVTYIAPNATSVTESANPVAIVEDATPVQLVEKAVASDGTVMLKLIAPGKGSSGYYPAEVLKRDGPRVFTAGMHNFIDHPTPAEESARPEGSIEKIGSTLVENAHWLESYFDATGKDAGPGLYARAKVKPGFADTLDVIATDIGTSIRASGKARNGTIDGYTGPIIEAITAAKSVDYVTMAGAGGKVLSLVESARNAQNTQGVNEMAVTEDVAALRETVNAQQNTINTLVETIARNGAGAIVTGYLDQYPGMPAATRAKLAATLPAQAPLTEARNAIDVAAFAKLIESAVATELQYIQSLGAVFGAGAITTFGSADPLTESNPAETAQKLGEELAAVFADPVFGLSESAAKVAANGR